MHLGTVIQQLCTKHNVQQTQVAKAVKKSPATVSNWIAGRFPPTAIDIIEICLFFRKYGEKHNKTLIKLMDGLYKDLMEKSC